MQPWDFIVVRDQGIKQKIKTGFELANKLSAEMFNGDKQQQYKKLKFMFGLCKPF
jgi:5,6-dimethylbenzimidazole synthase